MDMSLPARIARAHQRHLEAREERDRLLREASGVSIYRLSREIDAKAGCRVLSESMIRAIRKAAPLRQEAAE